MHTRPQKSIIMSYLPVLDPDIVSVLPVSGSSGTDPFTSIKVKSPMLLIINV